MSTEGESRPGQSFRESHHVEAVIFASREDISALLKSLHTVETRLASIRKEIDGLHIHIDLGKGKEQTWKRIQDQGLDLIEGSGDIPDQGTLELRQEIQQELENAQRELEGYMARLVESESHEGNWRELRELVLQKIQEVGNDIAVARDIMQRIANELPIN